MVHVYMHPISSVRHMALIRYGSCMVGAQIPNRRGNFTVAYLHYGGRPPDDLDQALTDVAAAMAMVSRARGTDREGLELVRLAQNIVGLRERLDAATIDVALRLKDQGVAVSQIATALNTKRPTIDGWLRRLHQRP